jgi:hypothetical protein
MVREREKGERPAATMYERERERDAARLVVEAVSVEFDEALERRLRHVEKHREKMITDARSDIEQARAALVGKLSELPELRQTLASAREALLWVASYPDAAEPFGHPSAVALGLRKPVESTLGTSARVEYARLLEAAESDANVLAGAFNRVQKQKLGIAEPRTPHREPMWFDDPNDADMAAFKKTGAREGTQHRRVPPSSRARRRRSTRLPAPTMKLPQQCAASRSPAEQTPTATAHAAPGNEHNRRKPMKLIPSASETKKLSARPKFSNSGTIIGKVKADREFESSLRQQPAPPNK